MRILRLLRGAPALALLLVVLSGCYISFGSDAPEEEQDAVTISLSDGETVRRGDLVEIEVTPPPRDPAAADDAVGAPYSVRILLQDAAGTEVTQNTVAYAEGETLPPLTLDDLGLSTNQYHLTVSLLLGDELIAEKTVDFNFVGDEYALREITSDAPIVHPGSTVSLTVSLDAPVGSDPVLVWSADGKVFAEGKKSEGIETVEWTSPLTAGIHTITVHLHVLGSSAATESLDTDVYVAPVTRPTGELGPEGSYLALFHLLGNLDDAGTGGVDAVFLQPAPLKLLTRGTVVGYRIDGQNGFAAPGVLLPLADGELSPFSIVVGYTPEDPTSAGHLVAIRSADAAFELRLGLGQGDEVWADMTLPTGTYRVATPGGAVRPEVRSEIVFTLRRSVAADTQGVPAFDAILYLDGRVAGSATWSAAPGSTPEGQTVVGGPGSATGLVDELGVYDRDTRGRPATDPEAFARDLALRHGDGAQGDGFDGMYLPEGYDATGTAQVAGGQLVLSSGARVTSPAYTIDPAGSSLRVTLSLGLIETGLLRLVWDQAGALEPAILEVAGRPGERDAEDRIEVTLTPEGDVLRVAVRTTLDAAATETTVPSGSHRALRLVLENRVGAAAALGVDEIAIWPTR